MHTTLLVIVHVSNSGNQTGGTPCVDAAGPLQLALTARAVKANNYI